METQNEERGYITRHELLQTEMTLRKEIADSQLKSEEKIERLTDKVDSLKDVVLPLASSSKETASNTKKMVESFERFAEKQYDTNNDIYKRINRHDITLEKRKAISEAKSKLPSNKEDEDKTKNSTWALIIGAIVTITVAIIQVAPLIFGHGTP
ncbi:hypothetical protein [Lederbergia lenta]|uniref:hypothetical protein n=1 Tax=Lederbergia lenta TaxID=1467 RepID=UPI0020422C64|nr:hypothetical protein [Lederbergia lenta]MCM3110056.1 hypothetical protein [Lederbergia lenta]